MPSALPDPARQCKVYRNKKKAHDAHPKGRKKKQKMAHVMKGGGLPSPRSKVKRTARMKHRRPSGKGRC